MNLKEDPTRIILILAIIFMIWVFFGIIVEHAV